ncbi:hypothetical protein [Deinococcus rubellus]|uniref:hypothetical protein n=1 Tax=Deinococcus rubellus TaxID=1889240 RepID=UPI0031EA086B
MLQALKTCQLGRIFENDLTLYAQSCALMRRLVTIPELQLTPEDVQIMVNLVIWQELFNENE